MAAEPQLFHGRSSKPLSPGCQRPPARLSVPPPFHRDMPTQVPRFFSVCSSLQDLCSALGFPAVDSLMCVCARMGERVCMWVSVCVHVCACISCLFQHLPAGQMDSPQSGQGPAQRDSPGRRCGLLYLT